MRMRLASRQVAVALAVAGLLGVQAAVVPSGQCAGVGSTTKKAQCACCHAGSKHACCSQAKKSCCRTSAPTTNQTACCCKTGGRLPMAPDPAPLREADS